MGKLDYFLGIEVKHLENRSLLLTQRKYICDLLCKVHMEGCKPISSPMISGSKLSKLSGSPFEGPAL